MNHHYRLPPPLHNNHFFNPNPNPNSNPNFNPAFIPAPPPPHPPQLNSPQPHPQTEPSTDAPLPDLSTSLSHLTDLLNLSTSTLNSLCSLLSLNPLPNSSHHLSRCPFNPNHLMPPESLFLHSLQCPSPVVEDVRSLLDDLQYPKTLKTDPQLISSATSSDLCFCFDDYVEFGSNFFYQDCPGVVSSLGDDAAKRSFSLPNVLSMECEDLSPGTVCEANDSFRLLPSELWVVKCEIGQWSYFPNAYSYTVLRGILCVDLANMLDIKMWVIANSPRFGVVIDPPMRDHIFVLFRLCVKAIVREARSSHDQLLTGNLKNAVGHLNPKSLSFSCPSLVEILSWLAMQLSVLYGEANAKLFTIGVLKEIIQNAASNSLVYPLDSSLDKVLDHELGSSSAGNLQADQPVVQVSDNIVDNAMSGGLVSRPVFIYQVAVAIAALYERSLFEDKIKALRNHQYMTAYQRLAEHEYLSKKAEDERQKRPNYRPLVDHDGLPVQCQHDKDMMNRKKTKEQLLAEERDYKRRRMSYRGKKSKRNVKEVMRDIIEEHMEAIRVAGGIGIFDNGVEDGSVSTYKPLAQDYGKYTEYNRSSSYDYEPSKHHHDVYHQHSNSNYITQTMNSAGHAEEQKASSRSRHGNDLNHRNSRREKNQDASINQRNGKRENDGHYSNQIIPGDETEGYSYPRSSSRDENYRSSRHQRSDWENEDDTYPRNPGIDRKYRNSRHCRSDREIYREEGDSYLKSPSTDRYKQSSIDRSSRRNESEEEIYKSRNTSSSHGSRSSSRTFSDVHSGRKEKRRSEDKDRERRKRARNERSDSMGEFDDRYAPSRSPDMGNPES